MEQSDWSMWLNHGTVQALVYCIVDGTKRIEWHQIYAEDIGKISEGDAENCGWHEEGIESGGGKPKGCNENPATS